MFAVHQHSSGPVILLRPLAPRETCQTWPPKLLFYFWLQLTSSKYPNTGLPPDTICWISWALISAAGIALSATITLISDPSWGFPSLFYFSFSLACRAFLENWLPSPFSTQECSFVTNDSTPWGHLVTFNSSSVLCLDEYLGTHWEEGQGSETSEKCNLYVVGEGDGFLLPFLHFL